MATDYQALIIPIGLDVSQFDKSIKDVMAGFKEISKTIKETPANLLTEETKKTYQELKRTVDLLQTSSFDKPFDKAAESANKGRTALTNLNLVVQDLPFGFIGIQNNLPALFSSFNRLSEETKGTGGAFKALLGQLSGPGGAFLAFTAVTSAVTFLTKEYGSLSNAIEAITSGNAAAFKIQQEFNKAVFEAAGNLSVENAKVQVLTKALLDSSTPREKQIAYYNELKNIAPDIVAGIKEENLGTKESNILIEANAKLREELTRLKVQEAGINAVLEDNSRKLAELRFNESKAVAALAKEEKIYNSLKGRDESQLEQAKFIKLRKDQLSEIRKEISVLVGVQDQYFKQLGETTPRIAEINNETQKRIDKLKAEEKAIRDSAKASKEKFQYDLPKSGEFLLDQGFFDPKNQLKRLQDYANVILDVKAKEKDRAEALSGFSADAADYLGYIDVTKLSYNQLEDAIKSYALYLQDLILIEKRLADRRKSGDQISSLTDDYFEAINKRFKYSDYSFGDFFNQFNSDFADGLSKEWIDSLEKVKKYAASKEVKDKIPSLANFQEIIPVDFDAINKGLKMIDDETARIKDNLIGAMSSLQDIIEKTFFDLLDTGAANWKIFADAVIKEVKRIIAALAVKTLVETLANLFAPGSGAAVKSLLKDVPTNELQDYLSGFPDEVTSANFGGIRGAGYEMNGAVNLTIRGNDLVGAINRTNTSIRRIG